MQNNIRNTNLRFNLDKEQQRRAWDIYRRWTGRILNLTVR